MHQPDPKLYASRIDSLFGAANVNIPLNLLGTFLVVFFSWNTLPVPAELGFLAVQSALAVLRFAMARRYAANPARALKARAYGRSYASIAFATGMLWGIFSFFAVKQAADPLHLTVVGLIASSIAFGGVANAIYPPVFYGNGAPLDILLVAGLIARGDDWGLMFGGLAIIIIPVHILIGRSVTKSTLEALRLRIENEALINDLVIARERAEAGNRTKSEFLAVMSHEIRTPMTAILGLSEVAIDRATDPQQLKELELVRESGEALLDLLNDILDLSKLEADKLDFESRPFELVRLVQSVVTLMSSRAAEKRLPIRLKIAEDAPQIIVGDSGRLRQILVNLIANAVKFTESGAIEIAVEVIGRDADHALLHFAVTDTGIGIAEELQSRIFDSFIQADSSVSRRFGGTGLGLAICRNIVERQGGRIGVASKPGQGSTFWFELRFAIAEAPELRRGLERNSVGRPLKILVAEDNAVNQLLVRTILERDGHQVDIVDTGRKAIGAAAAKPFDIILLDLQMPEMGGLEAARGIRALDGAQARIPILAFTAAASVEEVMTCRNAGMNGVVAKPFRSQDLIAAIARQCPCEPVAAP